MMKRVKRVLSVFVTIGIIMSYSMVSISASDPVPDPNAPANTRYSDIWVNASQSGYSSQTSATTAKRRTCYMRLRYCKFNYYPANNIPSGYYVYSRLYSTSTGRKSNLASFSNVTSPGNYNYSYLQYPTPAGTPYPTITPVPSGESFQLKTNSNMTLNSYEAQFDWSANPY